MQPVDIRSLNFLSKAGLCWSFFWRGILITLLSMLVGGILGGLFGFVMAMAGASKSTGMAIVQSGGLVLGLVSGCFCLYLYVKWLLSARLGGFRLMLVRSEAA